MSVIDLGDEAARRAQAYLIWFKVAALAALAGFLFVGGMRFEHGRMQAKIDADAKHQAEVALQASQEARRMEQQRAARAQEVNDAKDLELRRAGDRLADALERLRQRPDRLPEPARAACAGASGAELAAADAGFLERYAAIARRLQVELAACQQRAALSPFAPSASP